MQFEKLQTEIKAITKKRGANRQDALSAFCDSLHSELKSSGYVSFSRELLTDMFTGCKLQKTARYSIVQSVLSLMAANGQIKPEKQTKRCYSFRSRALFSRDYGSFALLMAKNGYKRTEITDGYDGEYMQHLNHLTGRFGHHTAVYGKSSKPVEQQGCFSGGELSIVRECSVYTKNIFVVL